MRSADGGRRRLNVGEKWQRQLAKMAKGVETTGAFAGGGQEGRNLSLHRRNSPEEPNDDPIAARPV
jgi:hypothetical protein